MNKIVTAALAIVALPVASLFAATRYVVPAGTAGNTPTAPYTSLATAANDIPSALDAAEPNDTVLILPGTYSMTQRYILTKAQHLGITIRSYDPDKGGAINSEDTIIDGSGVEAGTAVWNGTNGVFFANFNSSTSPGYTFDGLTFKNARGGAIKAMYTTGAQILNCNFLSNTNNYSGGAVCLYGTNKDIVSNCLFSANRTLGGNYYGGGLYHNIWGDKVENSPRVIDCTFVGNESYYGGGVGLSSHASVSNCTFNGNYSQAGVGSQVYMVAKGELVGCKFTGTINGVNSALGHAVYEQEQKNATDPGCRISGCTFEDIEIQGANAYCGLFYLRGTAVIEDCIIRNVSNCRRYISLKDDPCCTLTVRNCLFAGLGETPRVFLGSSTNEASFAQFDNCTIYAPGKDIVEGGDGRYSNVEFRNCIMACNKPVNSGNHVRTVTNCYVGGDPRFLNIVTGEFRLRSDSPCIDKATSLDWYADATDLAGRPRVAGAKADYGCYEWQADDPDFVGETRRLVATAEEKTGEWADAYTDFQTAIDATPDGGRLLVKPGLYRPAETLVISNRIVEVVSCGANGEPDSENTVIDGQGERRVMLVHWGETSTANSDQNPVNWRAVRLEGLTFKDGLALTNGATATQPFAGDGGGLLLYGRAPGEGTSPSYVVNCRFVGCEAVNGGGAALLGGWLENCTFTNCHAILGAGACGIEPNVNAAKITDYTKSLLWYSVSLHGCAFVGNTAERGGGGYSCSFDDKGRHTYVENCTFVSNKTDSATYSTWSRHGSGLARTVGSLVTNCTFIGNSGAAYGALYAMGKTWGVDLLFERNQASSSTSSLYFESSAGALFERCRIFEDPKNPTYGIFGCGTYRNCLVVNGSSTACLCHYTTSLHNTPLVLENCTLVNTNGCVIDFRGNDSSPEKIVSLSNCILWRKGTGSIHTTNKANCNSIYMTNCCISCEIASPVSEYTHKTGSFVNDRPGFVDANGGNFMLRGTTCRDKGVTLDWMTADAIDLVGNPRVYGDMPDLGCYECCTKIPGLMFVVR